MKKFNTLAFKLCLLSSLLVLGIIGVMSKQIMNEARASLFAELQVRASSFAISCREAMSPRLDPFSLHLQLRELTKGNPAVAYVAVSDASGRIISHTVAEKIGGLDSSPVAEKARMSENSLVQTYTPPDGIKYTDMAVPVIQGAKRLGTVRVGTSAGTISTALARTRKKIILIGAVSVVFAVIGTVLIVGWLTRPLALLAQAAQAVGKGKLDVTIHWKVGDEIGLLAEAFNGMVRGLRERDHIRQVFGRYVSEEIAASVLSGAVKLGGEKKNISVLFADIRNFSRMSANIPAEETVKFLNGYFGRMTKIVTRNGGTVDKFMGDAILAIFGAPLVLENSAAHAVSAALDMRRELAAFNKERKQVFPEPVCIGIAVNTGYAIVGNIGSEERTQYTVVGEVVNLASRLEGLNKRLGTDVLVSQSTCLVAGKDFIFESVGAHRIRGWEDPVVAFSLIEACISNVRAGRDDFGAR
ncbi:MAG: adenylate/guanylate cyclase domain-containing protein [bacterium]